MKVGGRIDSAHSKGTRRLIWQRSSSDNYREPARLWKATWEAKPRQESILRPFAQRNIANRVQHGTRRTQRGDANCVQVLSTPNSNWASALNPFTEDVILDLLSRLGFGYNIGTR